MNKKYITIILALIMMFSLNGCGMTGRMEPSADIDEKSVSASESLVESTPEPTPDPTPHPLIAPELTDRTIDSSFFEPAGEQGELVTIQYETYDYIYGPEDMYTKNMTVYLPYGYDERRKYDVLFLAPISGCNENWWLNATHKFEDPEMGMMELQIPTMLDNMIERGLCSPLIVINLNCYILENAQYEHNSTRDYSQFPREFRNDIMPAVKEQLSVYDEREHFGFLGASFGAYVDYLCILSDCFDLVGWHGETGGGKIDPDYLQQTWTSIGTQNMELCGLYIAEGEYDDAGPVMEGIYAMSQFDNLSYTVIQGAGHEYREWDIALYNALQIFFR